MNRFHRSKNDRMLIGLCGGLGEYFNIDPTFFRVIFAFIGLMSLTTTFIVYLICGIVIPEDNNVVYEYDNNSKSSTRLLIGAGLIVWGIISTIKNFFPQFTVRILNLRKFWPISLILLGIYILINRDKD